MRARRGVALLAALWLVVAIVTVAAQFAFEARERRTIGLLAAERGVQRAAAQGALALIQAKLDYALRVAPTGAGVAQLRAGDPWMDVDSAYTGTFYVDSMPVEVVAHDLNAKLNVNVLSENDLRTFFSFVLNDYAKATQLAQSIMDWRDADSIPRPSGAERDAYIKAGMLALPANAPFREIEELRDVMGMTPEIYAAVTPYLTTRGSGAVNVNTAPVAVLRALPGMTDATINQILQQRSQGRRINNLSQITGGTQSNGRPRPGQLSQTQLQTALGGRIAYQTREVELTLTARVGPQAQPSRLFVIVSNQANNANVSFREW